jgi:hypothetical protein
MSPKQAFRLAYGFLRGDGKVPWREEMRPYRDAAQQAWSDRVWHKDPLIRAATRRTYLGMDLATDRELNGPGPRVLVNGAWQQVGE